MGPLIMIKFISYTGRYPTLCSGTLTVEIDWKEVKFGHEACRYNFKTDSYDDDPDHTHLEKFWCSGGGLQRNYEGAYEGKWELDPYYTREANYPEEIKKLLPELLKVFNENVEHGCCGGCL